MIGQTLESPPRFPIGAALVALIGLLVLTPAIAQVNLHLILLSVLPLSIAAALTWAASRRFQAMVYSDRIEFYRPAFSLPFRELVSVYLADYPLLQYSTLLINSRQGMISIPDKINVPLREVHAFLAERAPPQPDVDPHPVMADYVQSQRDTFGRDRVFLFRARNWGGRLTAWLPSKGLYVSYAVMLTGAAWIVASLIIARDEYYAWLGMGIVIILIGFLFWFLLRRRPTVGAYVGGKLADSCLVISPLGIAMVQGDMRGKLRWDEIQKVVGHKETKNFQFQAAKGTRIFVHGSVIQVLDIYDAPLVHIESVIRRHL